MAYAIFKTGSKQYKVSVGDKVDVEKIPVTEGEWATFDQVLAHGEGAEADGFHVERLDGPFEVFAEFDQLTDDGRGRHGAQVGHEGAGVLRGLVAGGGSRGHGGHHSEVAAGREAPRAACWRGFRRRVRSSTCLIR